jgi:hypothetical protein
MASAGPAAADRIDSLPRWRAAAGRPAPAKQEREAGQFQGRRYGAVPAARCGNSRKRQHHAAHVARAGTSMRRCRQKVQVMAVSPGSQEQRPPEPPAEDAVSLSIPRPRRCSGGGCGADRLRYPTASRRIDVSSGGVADWPQYGRDQEGTWPRWASHRQVPRKDRTVERRCIHVERPPTDRTTRGR